MPFSPTEQQRIAAALISKGVSVDKPCPECAETKWSLGSEYFAPVLVTGPSTDGKYNFHGNAGFPSVIMFCVNCGYWKGFSMTALGLLSSDPVPALN